MFSLQQIISVTLILFSVIDILGSVPIVIELRKKTGTIHSGRATVISGIIMLVFLFIGEYVLKLLALDVASFSIAGAFVMFIIGMEMILGITLFREDVSDSKTASVVPLAFPLIAGAGTMTTLISLRAEYSYANILVGIVINLALVYAVLKSSTWLERKLGKAGFNVVRKVFGIILLAMAIKLFKNNWFA
ncbi:MAG: MarC family protein [Cytophagales bacterium]|nr:MarC family protein [Cytophagales bacterium]